MFYLIFGSDKDKVNKKADNLFYGLLKKKPDATAIVLSVEDVSEDKMSELLGGQGLFSQKTVVLLKRIFSVKENIKWFSKMIQDMKESTNVFILTEWILNKNDLERLRKEAEKTEEFNLKESEGKKDQPIVFSMADALERKDKKNLWRLYLKALKEGVATENILGTLFWKVKTMRLQKSRNYSEEEIKNLSSKIVDIYHEGRTEGKEIEILLEKFILSSEK